ncbi:MAG: hypothetical protein C4555_02660 [Dehalococcoidia bacterium]|jgi:predicted cobalt transporter CbtA|nr:MAG: hypothetical protein C4555_02660 [Dehalococcoidia bacterium]
MKKLYIFLGFVAFGIAAGFIAIWFREHTDSLFLLNIPGTLLGDAVYGISIRLFGDPHSSQAHYTIPWLLRIPQVYVPASVVFWGLVGTLLAWFMKPKIIAWIAGVYVALSISLYLIVFFWPEILM